MPWDKAGYKAQLQRDLKDIQHKLSRVLGKDLVKSDNSFVEATSPVNCIEGGILVDLCMQRFGKRGSGCDAPKSADRVPKLSKEFSKSSAGCPNPVASTPRPPTPPTAQIGQNSGRKYVNKEVCMYIHMLKPLKTRMEKEELKFKSSGSTNCRNHSDVMVSGVMVTSSNGDVTTRDINKPIARKRYATKKQSLVHSKGSLKSSLRICSQTFTKIAFIKAIVISILGGLRNINLLERKSPIGTSPNLFPSEPRVALCFRNASILSSLRESTATIISISEGLCSCIHKGIFLDNNKQLIRCMRILQNAITYEETFCFLSGRLKLATPYVYLGYATYELATFSQNVSAGKRLVTYIFLFVDFWAFRVYYLDTYAINLELDDNCKVFYALVYLYIFTFYHSWSSCNWAIYSSVIFHTLVYFSLNWIVSVIKSHDKYQSLIIIGLALIGKARLGNQYILFHFR